MNNWFGTLPLYGSGIFVVGGFVLLTVILGWIIGKLLPHEVRMQHNDLAGFILAVIGVVYAVLLAFVTVTVWERFTEAESRTYEEANAISVVYRDVGDYPQSADVRRQLMDYTEAVINEEWPAMNAGRESETANRLIEQVDREVRALPVKTLTQEDVHQQMLASMDTALSDRETRLSMDATGISGVMWMVLILGGVVTVGFTYLFGFRDNNMLYVMTGSLGILIGLVLFLTVSLDYPFRGAITVRPDAFHKAIETFHAIGP